jgi:hypothetical protein
MSTPLPECARHQELLLDFAYGELEGAPLQDLERHLPGCAHCQAELAALRSTRRVMGSLGAEPAPDAGLASLLAYAEQQAKRQQAAPAPSRPAWLRWLFTGVPVAAALVLVLTVTLHQNAAPLAAAEHAQELPPGMSVSRSAEAQAEPAQVAKLEKAPEPVAAAPVVAPQQPEAPALAQGEVGELRSKAPAKELEKAVAHPMAYEQKKVAAAKDDHAAAGPAATRGHAGGDGVFGRREADALASGAAADKKANLPAASVAKSAPAAVAAKPSGVAQVAELDSNVGPRDGDVAAGAPAPKPTLEGERAANEDQAKAKDEAFREEHVAEEETKRADEKPRVQAAERVAAVAPAAPPPPPAAAPAATASLADSTSSPGRVAANKGGGATRGGLVADATVAQAEAYRRSGDHAAAAAAYRAVYAARKTGGVAADALWNAAQEAYAAGLLAQAASDYELFEKEFRGSAYAPAALARAAEIRRSNEGEGAATTLEQDLLRKYPNSREAQGVASRQRRAMPAKAKKASRAVDFDDAEVRSPPAPAPAADSQNAR